MNPWSWLSRSLGTDSSTRQSTVVTRRGTNFNDQGILLTGVLFTKLHNLVHQHLDSFITHLDTSCAELFPGTYCSDTVLFPLVFALPTSCCNIWSSNALCRPLVIFVLATDACDTTARYKETKIVHLTFRWWQRQRHIIRHNKNLKGIAWPPNSSKSRPLIEHIPQNAMYIQWLRSVDGHSAQLTHDEVGYTGYSNSAMLVTHNSL